MELGESEQTAKSIPAPPMFSYENFQIQSTEHSHTHQLYSTIDILLYLFYHISILYYPYSSINPPYFKNIYLKVQFTLNT